MVKKKSAKKKVVKAKKKTAAKITDKQLAFVVMIQPCPCCNPAFTEEQCEAERQVYGFEKQSNADDVCEEIMANYPGMAFTKIYPDTTKLRLIHNKK